MTSYLISNIKPHGEKLSHESYGIILVTVACVACTVLHSRKSTSRGGILGLPKKLKFLCLDIFCNPTHGGPGTFYRAV